MGTYTVVCEYVGVSFVLGQFYSWIEHDLVKFKRQANFAVKLHLKEATILGKSTQAKKVNIHGFGSIYKNLLNAS